MKRADDPLVPPALRAHVARATSRLVFQSSMTSWSSKIIAVGTVESSQRIGGSLHDDAGRRACTPRSPATLVGRHARVAPGADERRGCRARPRRRRSGRRASAARAATRRGGLLAHPQRQARAARRPRGPAGSSSLRSVYGGSCGYATRQEPKTTSTGLAASWRADHAGRPAVVARPDPLAVERDLVGRRRRPGSRPASARARSGARRRRRSAPRSPAPRRCTGASVSTQTVASVSPAWRRSGPRTSDGIRRTATLDRRAACAGSSFSAPCCCWRAAARTRARDRPGHRARRCCSDFQPERRPRRHLPGRPSAGSTRPRASGSRIRRPGASTDPLQAAARRGRADAGDPRHPRPRPGARARARTSSGSWRSSSGRSPRCSRSRRIGSPRDLEGGRVGVTGLPSDDAVLARWCAATAGTRPASGASTIGFEAVKALLARRVDGATAFWNVEGVALRAPAARDPRVPRRRRSARPRYPELVLGGRRATTLEDRADEIRRASIRALQRGYVARRRATRRPPWRPCSTRERGLDRATLAAQLDAVAPAFTAGAPAYGVLDRGRLRAWARWDDEFGILERRARRRPGVRHEARRPRSRTPSPGGASSRSTSAAPSGARRERGHRRRSKPALERARPAAGVDVGVDRRCVARRGELAAARRPSTSAAPSKPGAARSTIRTSAAATSTCSARAGERRLVAAGQHPADDVGRRAAGRRRGRRRGPRPTGSGGG